MGDRLNIDLKHLLASTGKATPAAGAEGRSLTRRSPAIRFGRKAWPMRRKEAMYGELEILLKAGLDLKTCLDLWRDNQDRESDRQLAQQVVGDVVAGHSLSAALRKSGRFSSFEIFSVQIAESSGQLPEIAAELRSHFGLLMHYRKLLIGALSYPALVVTVALLAVIFLLRFLVPLFADIYQRLDQELPPVTQAIISSSNMLTNCLPWCLPVVGAVGGLIWFYRRDRIIRKWLSRLQLGLPIIGPLVHQLYLARLAQGMSFLLKARVPVLQALDLTEKMIGCYPLEQSLAESQALITQGESLHQALGRSAIFPARMISLLKVGEEANQLDEIFVRLAEQYRAEVEQRTKMLGAMIEPIMIVGLALVVGLILVAMYLPIFQLVTNFGL